jgi:deoxyguanosine kinase
MLYNFVVIEGNIGAGKTTLSKKIAGKFNANLILEQFADNPFLPKFYLEPEKYSFQLELSFLADRYHQLKKELSELDLFKSFILADYYVSKSLIFSKNTLSSDEFMLYRSIFDIIYPTFPKPDLYVYLHLNVDNCIHNIRKRARSYEQTIEKDYLVKIQEGYFEYLKQQKDQRILIIDTNKIDFVNNPKHFEAITETIFKNYPKEIIRISSI